jgi:hypothetical protein
MNPDDTARVEQLAAPLLKPVRDRYCDNLGGAISAHLTMERLTIDHLCQAASHCALTTKNTDLVSYFMALQVARHYLGTEWSDDVLQPANEEVMKANLPGREYMRTDSVANVERFRHVSRLLFLAELLFNLQSVEGFEKIIEDIKQGHLKSRLEELECASHLYIAAVAFRFIEPSVAQRQKNPDLAIILPEGGLIYCEVEGKGEGTLLDVKTLLNTLDHARKQLPSNQAGIIFLKIPEAWVQTPEIRTTVESALQQFFRNTNRVVSVMFRWEQTFASPDGSGGILLLHRQERNANSKLLTSGVSTILDQLDHPNRAKWIAFRLVAELHCIYG